MSYFLYTQRDIDEVTIEKNRYAKIVAELNKELNNSAASKHRGRIMTDISIHWPELATVLKSARNVTS